MELAEELIDQRNCESYQSQFKIAKRMRTTMLRHGVSWYQQTSRGYAASIRKAANHAGLDARDMLLGVEAAWGKVLLPEGMKAPEFAYLEAMCTSPRSRIIPEDFPEDDVRKDAELVLTMVEILDKWGKNAREEPYLPVRTLAGLLEIDKNYAQNLLSQLEILDYVRRNKKKGSTKKSPPISLGKRYFEAQTHNQSDGAEPNPAAPKDKGSKGSYPKESYDPEDSEGSKGPKRVGNSHSGAPIPRQQQPPAIDANTSLAASPEELALFDQVKARQQGEQKRIEKDQPGRLL